MLRDTQNPAGAETIDSVTMSPDEARVGPYQLLLPLGEGGMGTVWKARHTVLEKIVALKLLPDERVHSPALLARFQLEMKAVGRLSHTHIVQAFDAGAAEVPYLAMEYVDGTDLLRLLRERGPLPVANVCDLIRQAALGLQHAHEAGLVHRDVKPSNLMLTTGGVVKLLDLGLARLCTDEPGDSAHTAAHALLGTPDYMAPEQLLDAHSADIRADVYSLGCTLYHLLAGKPPFSGPDHKSLAAKRQAHLREAPPSLRGPRPDVPEALEQLVNRLLAKNPDDRPATPALVAEALVPFCTGSVLVSFHATSAQPVLAAETLTPSVGTITTPTPPVAILVPPPPKRSFLHGLIAVAAVVGLILGGLALWRTTQGPPSQPVRLVDFDVKHYRKQSGSIKELRLGASHSEDPQVNDLVRVTARFTGPAYCYLIAFNPDGADQLCYPARAEADKPPKPRTDLTYPTGEAMFQLDAAGLQAFALVATHQPLPSYAEWRKRLTPFGWDREKHGDAWRWNGESFTPLASLQRGKEEEVRTVPAPFKALCRRLREHGGAEVVSAVVFPVKPQEDR
jgi:serine/threonine protein kinase